MLHVKDFIADFLFLKVQVCNKQHTILYKQAWKFSWSMYSSIHRRNPSFTENRVKKNPDDVWSTGEGEQLPPPPPIHNLKWNQTMFSQPAKSSIGALLADSIKHT